MTNASLLGTWRANWRDYAIEGMLLGGFMVSACVVTALLEYPGWPLRQAIPSFSVRLAIIGLAMGVTAYFLFTNRYGRRTGAHMNPAVTLVFLRLGRMSGANAAGYITGQFLGGLAGVLLSAAVLGDVIRDRTVNYAVTVPGPGGVLVAWVAEFVLSFGIIFTVLSFGSRALLARWTPVAAATLVGLYVALEAPISGMSINPARTFASALPAGVWTSWWIYFTAPLAGMFAGAAVQQAIACRAECARGGNCGSYRCLYCCPHRKSAAAHDAPAMAEGEAA